jgi:ABC-type nitrate/sulfonate/bicarbonate transport system permease component
MRRAIEAGLQRAGRAAADYAPSVAFLVAVVAGWEAAVRTLDVPAYILPAPSRIWSAFERTRATLPEHIITTLREAIAGIAYGAAVGAALAVALAALPLLRRVLYPILVTSQTIPMIVLAPILVVWFGFGETPKVVLVALWAFFPVTISMTEGLLNADRELIGLVRSMGGSRWDVLRHVLVPSALPALFAGLKIAAAYSVAAAVIAEYMGAQSGLGLYISRSAASFRTDQMFVAIGIIAAASIALFALVHLIARLVTPWMYLEPRGGKG